MEVQSETYRKKFYRYTDIQYTDNSVSVIWQEYYLLRETPKGYWVSSVQSEWSDNWIYRKWFKKDSKKQFAFEDKTEALEDFIRRKRHQKWILESRISRAECAINIAKRMKNGDTNNNGQFLFLSDFFLKNVDKTGKNDYLSDIDLNI